MCVCVWLEERKRELKDVDGDGFCRGGIVQGFLVRVKRRIFL